MSTQPSLPVSIVYPVTPDPVGWVLVDEENMSESELHRVACDTLRAVLAWWIERTGRDAETGCNRGVRWDAEHPTWGVDPDVHLIEPRTPAEATHVSLRTWHPGVSPPRLAVEVVSENNAVKDYLVAPDKYAASGTYELWVFDPLRMGPAVRGGPHLLQVWRRDRRGRFRRVYAGDGGAWSRAVNGWVVITDGDTRVRIADDVAGTKLWPTREESESRRADEEKQRADEEKRRADALQVALASIGRTLSPEALDALPPALRDALRTAR